MDIFKVLRPLHILTLFTAIASYRETTNKNGFKEYKSSKLLSIFTFLFPIGPAIWSTFSFRGLVARQDDSITFLNLAFCVHLFSYVVICYSNNFLHGHYLRIVNRIYLIDVKLKSLHINPNERYNYLTFMVAFEYCSIFVNCFHLTYVTGSYVPFLPICMRQVKEITLIHVLSVVYLIYFRFKLINDRLSIIKNLYSESSRDFKLILAHDIRDLCDMHDKLSVIRGIICTAFQIQVVSSIFSLTVFSLVLIRETNINVGYRLTDIFVMMFFDAVCCNFCMFILALTCTKCLNQVIVW